jgi:hypothetical protein
MPDQLWFYLDGRPMIKGGPITEAMKKATDGWTYYILDDTEDGVSVWRLKRRRSQLPPLPPPNPSDPLSPEWADMERLEVFPHTRGGWSDAYQEILRYEYDGQPARGPVNRTKAKPRGARQPAKCPICHMEHAGECP